MRHNNDRDEARLGFSTTARAAALCALLLSAFSVAPAEGAPPPKNRTYFTVFLGLDTPYGAAADCLTFRADEFCAMDGLCGTWERNGPAGPQSAFSLELSFQEQGQLVQMDGQGRIEDRGKKDSIAAVVRGRIGSRPFNFGFTGRATSRRKCAQLVRGFSREHPPQQARQDAQCLQRANLGDPAASQYLLPYPVNRDYRVSQTYCSRSGGHSTQLAYDFAIPVGAQVIAARAGTVVELREDLPDDGSGQDPTQHNHINIQHDDGTVAFYAHLQQNGVVVQVGDAVAEGQLIAASGNSGNTGGFPHLHFGVYEGWPAQEGQDLPVNFRNADGPLDGRDGLIQDVFYKALPE